jgi:hypothetical protein
MPDARGTDRPRLGQDPEVRAPQRQGPRSSNPRAHAARLLDQADRLMQLAHELRREARRLNAAFDARGRRQDGSKGKSAPPAVRAERDLDQSAPVSRRRFAPAAEGAQPGRTRVERHVGELEISEGARLMITNLATAGASREEILGQMRDVLGIENAESILNQLTP